ncbi:MAG: 3-phosphoshikimate 1-carboxyvinyltransferase [Bacillota bacterium]|nr:3-phosphoshikimate 1-carboxyvinyltransferase [Bacillota bacterium]
MYLIVEKSNVSGRVHIPGSKSHTIRALFFASLASGKSEIYDPLLSNDADSAVEVCKALGAKIDHVDSKYIIEGFAGKPITPADVINVGNSGTTMRFAVSTASLSDGCSVLTGDYQIRRRPLAPLIKSLNDLGANIFTTRDNGMAPVVIKGKLKGGKTSIDAITSQYLSSLLIHAPLLVNDTHIEVTRLNEAPYVEMTIWWLDKLGIKYENNDLKSIYIYGNQPYKPFNLAIPGDFSSATFFAVQAAISSSEIELENLDMTDPQGDKLVFSILKEMGATVEIKENTISVKGNSLKGAVIDMNSIPDALPAMAVLGCFAEGETRLINAPQARLKETDRIAVMCKELKKLGADIEELPDGLIIRKSMLRGAEVEGHDDHRIVMALAIAGLNIDGKTIIKGAEAYNITFPEFGDLIKNCGGNVLLTETL